MYDNDYPPPPQPATLNDDGGGALSPVGPGPLDHNVSHRILLPGQTAVVGEALHVRQNGALVRGRAGYGANLLEEPPKRLDYTQQQTEQKKITRAMLPNG